MKDTRATFEPAQRLAERIGTDLQKDVNQGSHIRTKAPMGLATDKTDYLTTSQARHSTRSPLVLVGVILPAACRWARALGTRAPRRASRTAGEPRANPSTSAAAHTHALHHAYPRPQGEEGASPSKHVMCDALLV